MSNGRVKVRVADTEALGALLRERFGAIETVRSTRTTVVLSTLKETAQLATMSLKAADIHDEQARLITQRLVALAVPIITIVMGFTVAAIVGSLMMAMLSLNDLAI